MIDPLIRKALDQGFSEGAYALAGAYGIDDADVEFVLKQTEPNYDAFEPEPFSRPTDPKPEHWDFWAGAPAQHPVGTGCQDCADNTCTMNCSSAEYATQREWIAASLWSGVFPKRATAEQVRAFRNRDAA